MRLHESAVEPLLGEPAGNRANAFDLVAITSQPGFVGDAFELRQIVGEPTFLIRLPKKLSVRQSRPQNPFVSGAHQSLGIFWKIDDRKKMRRDFPAALLYGEILLMAAHDGDQDFIRQREERRIEFSLENARAFIQVGDQLQQFGVLVDAIPCPLCMRRQLFRDLLAPLRRPNDYAIRSQFLFVVCKVLDLQWAFAEKPMTERNISCGYSGKGKLQRLAVHYRNNPADGANESCAIEAGPGHGPRPSQVMNHAWQYFVQNLLGGSAALRLLCGQDTHPSAF